MTFRQFLTHPAAPIFKGLLLWAAVALFVGARALTGGFDVPDRGSDSDVMAIRPQAEGSPAALLAANDCWTGEAPADMAGKFPGHVVVTVDGHTRVGGPRMVGLSLGQLFDGEQHGLTVHGFCR